LGEKVQVKTIKRDDFLMRSWNVFRKAIGWRWPKY